MDDTGIPSIVAELKTLIADRLDVNLVADEIDENEPFFEGGMGIDSVAVIELIVLTEEQFGVEFADEDLVPDWFRSLRAFAELVAMRRGPEGASHLAPGC